MSLGKIADFCRMLAAAGTTDFKGRIGLPGGGTADDRVYPDSVNRLGSGFAFIAKIRGCKKLVLVNYRLDGELGFALDGESAVPGGLGRTAPLTSENAAVLRRAFPFTAPAAFGRSGLSVGLGDRLGLASPGHIRVVRPTAARPVLAQQSVREMNLTERTFDDVLADATWAVFQEGYRDGWGADGDHLKKTGEVAAALAAGFTMITLDCSEKIDNQAGNMTPEAAAAAYRLLPAAYRQRLESAYLGRTFQAAGLTITFDATTLEKCALIYGKALAYTKEVYEGFIKPCPRTLDFELSIDETATPTTPAAHYFVAAELAAEGIEVTSLAPRFIGEFQKAIDYIGDLAEFEQQFRGHAAIADQFGYRLSIHSGSDKFSVYPAIARHTRGRVHVKTAGTNWLEALKVLARQEPALLRRIWAYALANFGQATQYYHVTTNLANIPALESLADGELPALLEENPDVRQMLHITYGVVLTARTAGGAYLFREEIYAALGRLENEYALQLQSHIGKHLRLLGQPVPER